MLDLSLWVSFTKPPERPCLSRLDDRDTEKDTIVWGKKEAAESVSCSCTEIFLVTRLSVNIFC